MPVRLAHVGLPHPVADCILSFSAKTSHSTLAAQNSCNFHDNSQSSHLQRLRFCISVARCRDIWANGDDSSDNNILGKQEFAHDHLGLRCFFRQLIHFLPLLNGGQRYKSSYIYPYKFCSFSLFLVKEKLLSNHKMTQVSYLELYCFCIIPQSHKWKIYIRLTHYYTPN